MNAACVLVVELGIGVVADTVVVTSGVVVGAVGEVVVASVVVVSAAGAVVVAVNVLLWVVMVVVVLVLVEMLVVDVTLMLTLMLLLLLLLEVLVLVFDFGCAFAGPLRFEFEAPNVVGVKPTAEVVSLTGSFGAAVVGRATDVSPSIWASRNTNSGPLTLPS